MERKPAVSTAIQGFPEARAPSFSSPGWRMHDRYDRQASAATAQISVYPTALGVLKVVAALVFYDLLRAYGISRSRRLSYGRLAE